MLLVGNGRVITRDPANPYLEDGAVVTDGTEIREVGTLAEMKAKYPQAQFVDARGGVIMPGLINAHTHIYSGLARGLAIAGKNPRNFVEVLEDTWWNIDRHLTLDGTRANLCYEVSERDGAEKCEEAIRENAEFARWAAQQNDDMISAMFGGHALFNISNRTFEKMVEANDGLTGFHIHVAEGLNDVYDSLNYHQCYPIERLKKIGGILGEKTMLGHCIHLTDSELDTIAATGTMVVNNPQSNMGNAVGCSPVLKMFQKGIHVCMGTDAYTHDMLESLKTFWFTGSYTEDTVEVLVMRKRIVIALGGNALGKNLAEQMDAVKTTARAIVDLIEET